MKRNINRLNEEQETRSNYSCHGRYKQTAVPVTHVSEE